MTPQPSGNEATTWEAPTATTSGRDRTEQQHSRRHAITTHDRQLYGGKFARGPLIKLRNWLNGDGLVNPWSDFMDYVHERMPAWFAITEDFGYGVIDWIMTRTNKLSCKVHGHFIEGDQCGMPEHDFCVYCQKTFPYQAYSRKPVSIYKREDNS